MKVYINRYRSHWLSPFTIMTAVLFYKKWTDPKFDLYDDANDKYTDWLVKPCEYLQKLLNVVHPKIDYVKIDRYDTWSMDHTLGSIILPMLKQLKKDKHGAPFVDDEDVPEELKSTIAPPKENEYDTDANHFKRWDWVLDEMIQAFECKVTDNWEEQYSTGVSDFKFVKEQHSTHGTVSRMADGPNHTRKTDWDGLKAHQARNTNGYRLFGKYFEGLWN
jgi:hypothetical protein